MKNPIISVPSVSGFIFGLVGLPLIKIGGLLLVCKIILVCGLDSYMWFLGAITLISLVYIIIDYVYPSKKDVSQKKNKNADKFLKGFAFGVIVLFVFLIIFVMNEFQDLGLGLQDLRDLF
jgi:Na+/H+ antiporter NhaD/arsenite permease-like protein